MQALAAYIMRGRLQAMLAAAGFAILSLMLMPLSWPASFFSGAVIALVALAHGPRNGVLTALGAGAIMALITGLILNAPLFAGIYALTTWLPAWILAVMLWWSRSLAISLSTGALLGVCILLGIYALIPDPADMWYSHMTEQVLPVLKEAGMQVPADEQIKIASRVMTGTGIAMMIMGTWLSLLIARSWQAKLYNPNGFREEFHSLRLGQVVTGLTTVVLLLVLFLGGGIAELAMNILLVLIGLFAFQGLAIGHNLVAQYQKSMAWLVGMYVLIVFTSPYGLAFIATIGLLDNGIDFRKRFALPGNTTQNDD